MRRIPRPRPVLKQELALCIQDDGHPPRDGRNFTLDCFVVEGQGLVVIGPDFILVGLILYPACVLSGAVE